MPAEPRVIAMRSEIKLTILDSTDKASIVAISGHLGMEASQELDRELKKATSRTHKSSIIDLSGVDFITSYGVRLFLDVLQALEKEGKKLFLVNPQPSVKEVLVDCEMDTLAGIFDTKEAALAAL